MIILFKKTKTGQRTTRLVFGPIRFWPFSQAQTGQGQKMSARPVLQDKRVSPLGRAHIVTPSLDTVHHVRRELIVEALSCCF